MLNSWLIYLYIKNQMHCAQYLPVSQSESAVKTDSQKKVCATDEETGSASVRV